MQTKGYCPDCGSLRLRRLKRSLIEKVMRLSPRYECSECGEQFSQRQVKKNKPKEVFE